MKSVEEYITKHNPSMKYLRLYFRDKGIFIDTTDRRVVDNLRLPHELKSKTSTQVLKAMSRPSLDVDSYLWAEDDDYGLGRVVQFYKTDDDLMLVLFEERDLPTMCSRKSMTTVHDNENRKLKLIY